MQRAGTNCRICGAKIVSDAESTGCYSCKSFFHNDCLIDSGGQCSFCNHSVDPIEAHFVYSKLCPECVAPIHGYQDRCNSCGAWTRWDDRVAYETFVAEHRKTSTRLLWKGIALTALGVISMIVFVTVLLVQVFSSGGIRAGVGPAAVALVLIPKGIWQIRTARLLQTFQ